MNTDFANRQETIQHINKMKAGEPIRVWVTDSGKFISAAMLDVLVKDGLLTSKFYGPATYGATDWFKR